MQVPRVIIAAVFFVIGLLIAVPALLRTMSGSSDAAESPAPTDGATPSATATPPGDTASSSPAPTATPSTRPSPAQPLRVTVGRVECPSRTVVVTVRNVGDAAQDYTVETDDGTAPKGDQIGPGQSRTTRLTLREDRRTRVTVTWRNEPVEQVTRTANCRRAATSSPEPDEELPYTGPGDGVLWARAATGVAAMITGAIIVWYSGIWPRRREQIFDKS